MGNRDEFLQALYYKLYSAFGPQHWWPGDNSFEVMVGAILTQNTSWSNVERAIKNLKDSHSLNPLSLHKMSNKYLSELIRPAGYFNIKAKRLKAFIKFFMHHYSGEINRMKKVDTWALRKGLLGVNGIGPETADSILLYALERPVFVIDIYTKRVLSRHEIMDYFASYDSFQSLFHVALSRDVQLFNEYHALFVKVGKEFCKPKPRCEGCPLSNISP